MLSVVIPVYRNEESLPELLAALRELAARARAEHGTSLQAVFVVDGSPDASHRILAARLPTAGFPSRLLLHSRNFGSFAAIRTGLASAQGDYLGVMAADLQEPPELMLAFLAKLAQEGYDVVVGCRSARADPLLGRLASSAFWTLYRRLVNPQVPAGGVDVFGCTGRFRDELLRLGEANSSLIGLIFWLGFRRAEVAYVRRPRKLGKSAWSLSRRIDYLLDSVFSFTDLPIRMLAVAGILGMAAALGFALIVALAKVLGDIPVPGYAATVLTVLFFGGLNAFGLGIVGSYTWRSFENTKARPLALVMASDTFSGTAPAAAEGGKG